MGIVREYRAGSDTEAIAKLNKSCYDDPCSDVELLDQLRSGQVWVCQNGAVVVGCLIAVLNEGQPYVWSVTTHKEFRGLGIASQLLEEFEKYYRKAGSQFLWLHVRQDNPAQKLYFDRGFRVLAVEDNFYGEREDGLVMLKKLA